MTSIERTAYPRLNSNKVISQKNLHANYTLCVHEVDHIKNVARTNKLRLSYALQLKTFQNIGYFIDLDQIPQAIVIYLRKQLGVPHNTQLSLLKGTTLYRYNQSIRKYLGVTPWGLKGTKSARRVAIRSAYQAAQMLNIPADIINVIIEELRTQQYELPAFSTLRRLVQHVRSRVNRAIFQGVSQNLAQENRILTLAGLLKVPEGKLHSPIKL